MVVVTIAKAANGLFSIKTDGRVVGCGSMIVDDDGCYLERLDIDEQHRCKGYGAQALQVLVDAYGLYCLAPDNADAKRLYDRVADEMRQKDYDAYGYAIDQGYGVYTME